MKISSYLMESIRNQFESFCKRVLQNEARDCYRELERMSKKMVLFSELTAEQLNTLCNTQEYDSDFYLFEVYGYKVRVRNQGIGEAISKLPKKKQDIILLSFFLDMSEADIAKYLKIGQSNVHYHKTNSLKELKNLWRKNKVRGINKKKERKLLSFQTILDTTKGDPLAMEKVLKHFKGYMITLSTRKLTDEFGNTYSYVDSNIYRRLEIKLITAVVTKFKVDVEI